MYCHFCPKIDCPGDLSCVAVHRCAAVRLADQQPAARQRLMAMQQYAAAGTQATQQQANTLANAWVLMPGSSGGSGGSYAGEVMPSQPLPSAGMKVEDLIGWRVWRVKNGHLWSYFQDYVWMPGEVSEGIPGDHDHAGIWAFKDKRRAFQKALDGQASYVWGSVLLWGQVVEHADGYRASKARIVSIGGATRDVSREVMAELCEIHGVAMPAHVPTRRPESQREFPRAITYGSVASGFASVTFDPAASAAALVTAEDPTSIECGEGRPRHSDESTASLISGLCFIIGAMFCYVLVTGFFAWALRS